jgi:acylaminoacyl-peptidase
MHPTVIRTVRDVEADCKRKYFYSVPLNSPLAPPPPTELSNEILLRLPSFSGFRVAIFKKVSESSTVSASCASTATSATTTTTVLELWSEYGHALERRILLPTTPNQHGAVCFDDGSGTFGGPAWNSDETALVYCAARVEEQSCSSFFDLDKDQTRELRGKQDTLGHGFTQETWGESFGSTLPLQDIYVVHVSTGRVARVENVPGRQNKSSDGLLGSFAVGQVVFAPDGQSVVYTAWDAGGGGFMPRRLGLVYCQQRPRQLYQSSIVKLLERLTSTDVVIETPADAATAAVDTEDEPFVPLTPNFRIAFSPRFSQAPRDVALSDLDANEMSKKAETDEPPAAVSSRSVMVFLACPNGMETHSGCFALYAVDWSDGRMVDGTMRALVDIVRDPVRGCAKISPNKVLQPTEVHGLPFPGLFLFQLPTFCFSSPNRVFLTTQWGSLQKMVFVELSDVDGRLQLLRVNNSEWSESLLCLTPDGGAVLSVRSPHDPDRLVYVSAAAWTNGDHGIDSVPVITMRPIATTRFSCVASAIPPLAFATHIEILANPPIVEGVSVEVPVQSLLLLPHDSEGNESKPPLIVVPHGGPHSCLSAIYLPSYAFLCGHGGYAVLLVNYRGSTGFGQDAIEALPGRCGILDVADVLAATSSVIGKGLVDASRVGICGGSHGGFLTAHCTTQSTLFKAAAMRNPVVNIPAMVTATDIPDWCYVETFGKYHWDTYRPPTSSELDAMWSCSPIRYLLDATPPATLVALGMSDLRVPPTQGLEWYHALRAKGVPTSLLQYEKDDHAINGVKSEADHWINIKLWFDKYLK